MLEFLIFNGASRIQTQTNWMPLIKDSISFPPNTMVKTAEKIIPFLNHNLDIIAFEDKIF